MDASQGPSAAGVGPGPQPGPATRTDLEAARRAATAAMGPMASQVGHGGCTGAPPVRLPVAPLVAAAPTAQVVAAAPTAQVVAAAPTAQGSSDEDLYVIPSYDEKADQPLGGSASSSPTLGPPPQGMQPVVDLEPLGTPAVSDQDGGSSEGSDLDGVVLPGSSTRVSPTGGSGGGKGGSSSLTVVAGIALLALASVAGLYAANRNFNLISRIRG